MLSLKPLLQAEPQLFPLPLDLLFSVLWSTGSSSLPTPAMPGTYQAILRDTQDHLIVEVSTSEVLCNGQPAQAVAGVVEIPGSVCKELLGCSGGIWASLMLGSPVFPPALTFLAYPAARQLGTGSTGGCIPAVPAGRTSSVPCSALDRLEGKPRGETPEKVSNPSRGHSGDRGSLWQLTPSMECPMEQGQEPSLPKGVAPIHQLVAAALESALEAHLPPGHPALRVMGTSVGPKIPSRMRSPVSQRRITHQQAPEVQEMLLLEDDQCSHTAESVATVRLHAWYTANPTLPVLAPVEAGSGRHGH